MQYLVFDLRSCKKIILRSIFYYNEDLKNNNKIYLSFSAIMEFDLEVKKQVIFEILSIIGYFNAIFALYDYLAIINIVKRGNYYKYF